MMKNTIFLSLKKGIKWSVRSLIYLLLTIFIGVAIYLNIRLYYSPTYIEQDGIRLNKEVWYQLNYLKDYLHKGGGEIAQAKYPEGFVFINALYALAWCDFIEKMPLKHSLRIEGLAEVDWALEALNSNYAASFFPYNIQPSRGIFYMGWINYVLGRKLLLQDSSTWNIADKTKFVAQSEAIYKAYKTTNKTYLASYVNLAWPADNIVGIASLALYEQIDSAQYRPFIQDWIKRVKKKLDPQTELIPHEVDFNTTGVLEGAKGSSQSLILNFLLDIDPQFAREQFEQYQIQFLDSRFGLPGIREYPKGTTGLADVDSGPVLLDIGGSASLVGQRTMAKYGAITTAIGLRNSIESFGVAYTSKEQKRYVLGLEPIADAFILWANVINIEKEEKEVSNWRWAFQCLSLGILGAMIALRKRKQKN